jgi:hypothetical protein
VAVQDYVRRMVSVHELIPKTEELGHDNPRYLARVSPLLPNFPAEVLSSWFGEQPDIIEKYAFLGFKRFMFTREKFLLECLPGDEALRPGSKSLKTLAEESAWKKRGLTQWMKTHGTWPVPPIILNTVESALPPFPPIEFKTPYHLLEGYHRLALAHHFVHEAGIFVKPLPFWVVRISSSDVTSEA